MRVLRSFDDLTPVPWANGAGETTELISLTESETITPKRRPWRLSVARLERTGPFSSLPGMARTFLPVGAEVTLEIDGHVQRVLQTEPAYFTGDQGVTLVDLPAPCFALNLMVAAEGQGSGSDRPALEMVTDAHPGFQQRERFAVTLEATAEHPRFRLIHLAAGEAPPGGRVAYLR